MKKLLALILAALMVLTGVAALAEDFEVSQDYSSIPMEKTGDYDASGDPAAELMFTSVSVTGDSHTTAMSAFADAVKEFSGGSIECQVYPVNAKYHMNLVGVPMSLVTRSKDPALFTSSRRLEIDQYYECEKMFEENFFGAK